MDFMVTVTSELTARVRELLDSYYFPPTDRGEALNKFKGLLDTQHWFPMYEVVPGMWIKAHKIALAEFDKRFYAGC